MPNETKEENRIKNAEFQREENSAERDLGASFKRRVVAFTVGAVVLLCLLIILMCYQMITIGVKNRQKNDLTAEIAALHEEYERGEGELAFRRTNLYIERIARELGYHYADDLDK